MEIKKELIHACLKKDRASQKALYDILLPYLNAVCRRYITNQADVKDALQETFINIFRNIDKYDKEKSQFKTWSVRIAINASLKTNLKMNKGESAELTDNTQCSTQPEIIQQLSNEELMNFLKTMPRQLFEIYNLRFIDGYSHKEIAETLKIEVELSRKRLSRARTWLKERVNLETIDSVGIIKIFD